MLFQQFGLQQSQSDPVCRSQTTVIKVTHGCGFDRFVIEKADEDRIAIQRQAARWLRDDFHLRFREWADCEVPRRIFVEPFIGVGNAAPLDYKFFVFHGKAHFVYVLTDRWTEPKITFFDTGWNRQPIRGMFPPEREDLPKPVCLSSMISAAETLCRTIDFARVDFYEVGGRPIFGEMTIYPGAGNVSFEPRHYDRFLGDLWTLRMQAA